MKIEEEGLSMGDLTLEQLIELNYKSMIYGVVYAIKYKDGTVEIVGLDEEEVK